MKISLARVRLTAREWDAVKQVLKSGRLRAGRIVEAFEAEFARAAGARHAIAVNSGTSALFLAYRALLKPGDEVIVPDFTFVATASMALAAGARPVFADVDAETFNLDPADVERRITPRTRAIAPVHLYGQPADIRALTRLARRHHLRIIWDAAQAHGATYAGLDIGSFPDVVCYSFYPSKNITTGEGGMLTTSNAALTAALRLARSHGERRRYQHVSVGFNFRLTDFAAALGREQLRTLPAALAKRRRNAAFLSRALSGVPGLHVPNVSKDSGHAFNLFTVRLDSKALGMSRARLQAALARRGIESAVHYPLPLHRQPIFRGFGRDADFPVSTHLAETVLSLPVHPYLSLRDLHRMAAAIRAAAGC